ncbi:MAG: transposase [Anaerolineales bacterium]|nr:transposase [Anaerolineales bacterium]
MVEDFDLNAIQEENARELIKRLLNLIETLSANLWDSRMETQRYRDEVNRLKGEQGKPKIKGNKPKPPTSIHSSEKERHKRKRHVKSSKKAEIQIDREEMVDVDRGELPADAEYKGSEDVVVQDLVVRTDNVCFHKQKYYSALMKTTHLAKLPKGYEGQYGPGIKTPIVTLYFGMGTSEPKILEFFENMSVQISAGELSNMPIKDQAAFHAESDAVYDAGLHSSPYQQTDDTKTRVNGQNQHCHVVCNPVYTSYHTRPRKDRLTVLDVLRQGRKRVFRLNGEALGYLEKVALSKAARENLPVWCSEQDLDEVAFLGRLDSALPALNTSTMLHSNVCSKNDSILRFSCPENECTLADLCI